jgi:hypothetical protein
VVEGDGQRSQPAALRFSTCARAVSGCRFNRLSRAEVRCEWWTPVLSASLNDGSGAIAAAIRVIGIEAVRRFKVEIWAGRPPACTARRRDGASGRGKLRRVRKCLSGAPAAPLDRHQREEAEQRGEDQTIALSAGRKSGTLPLAAQGRPKIDTASEAQRHAYRPGFHRELLRHQRRQRCVSVAVSSTPAR